MTLLTGGILSRDPVWIVDHQSSAQGDMISERQTVEESDSGWTIGQLVVYKIKAKVGWLQDRERHGNRRTDEHH